MFSRLIHFLLLCQLVVATSNTFASTATTVIITPEQTQISLGAHLQVFEDTSSQWRVDQLSKKFTDHLFHTTEESVPVFGWSQSPYWARITLVAPSDNEKWLLEFPYVFTDEVTLYIPEDNGGFSTQVAGDHYPFSERIFDHNHFVFPIELSTTPKTFFLRVKSTAVVNFNVVLWEPQTFAQQATKETLLIGLFFGVMLIMVAYNLVIYFSVRDISYLYYVCYITAISFSVAGLHGLSSQYLWVDATWWADRNPLVFLCLSGVFGILFTQSFLQTQSYSPGIHRVMAGLMFLYVALLPLCLWGPYTSITRVVNFMGFPFSVISLFAGFFVWRKGSRYARYYLLAWSGLLLSVFIYELALFGILPSPFTLINFVQVGFIAMVVLLSLGLADRITELENQVNEAQANAIDNLRKADELKDEFLANTSHELRTPLNAIVGLAESLISGVKGDMPLSSFSHLNMIVNSAKRLSSLVNDIIDFSQLKHHELVLNKQPIDLHVITDVVISLSKPLALDKPIVISNAVEKDEIFVDADENRLQQILFNLIGNAIKFTERGKVTVFARTENEKVIVSVSDTGVGIPKDQFEAIFKMFEQSDGSISREYGGSGLGLSITKKLIELHGGHIWVQSSVNEGSVFSFSLPRAKATAIKEIGLPSVNAITAAPTYGHLLDSSNASAVDSQSNYELDQAGVSAMEEPDIWVLEGVSPKKGNFFRILIVDDEPINRQILVDHLSIKHYETTEADNGPEALRIVEEEGPFDLVLLDIMMPKMSGYEVSQRIRAKHPLYELPIIFLTARNQISDLVSGFVSGGNDFITKPVMKNELYARVNAHLQLKDINTNLEHIVKERTAALSSVNKELETLDGIVRSINQEVDLDGLLDTLLTAGFTLFPSTQKSVYLQFDEDQHRFFCAACYGYDIAKLRDITVNWSELVVHYTNESDRLQKGIFIVKPKSEMPVWRDAVDLPQPESTLAIAMHVDEKLHGFLILLNFSHVKAFDSVDIEPVVRFREHAVSALTKTKLLSTLKEKNIELQDAYRALEEVSLTDQLTSMRNRRFLLTNLEADVAHTLRDYENWKGGDVVPTDSDILFFMMDIDHFKKINDNYGHAAGDQVLMQMKPIFEKVFRISDYFVRWGGEEFLIVGRFSSCQQASMLAERLRKSIADHEFDIGDGINLRLTCSIGFACYPFKPTSPALLNWVHVVDIADYCLYLAKKSQRNAWVGMLANERTQSDMLLDRIRHSANKLVDNGEVQLITSIENKDTIIWR